MKNWIKDNRKIILMMIAYSVISFVLILFHEPWRDEAQSWLIVRDLNVSEIIRQLQYEGHFLLWYMILIPFAKLGFPYITINIISWCIVNIAVWLILSRSPFQSFTKLLIIFSFPMIYLFPVVSRCYALVPIGIALLAITHEKRMEKPLLYMLSMWLLANTHVIMWGFIGVMLIDFLIEWSKNIKNRSKKENQKIAFSLLVVTILLLISALPLFGSLQTNESIHKDYSFDLAKVQAFIRQVKISLFSLFGSIDTISIIIYLLLLVICGYYELKHYPKNFVIMVISVLYQFVIYVFVLEVNEQKISTVLMMIVFFEWIQIGNSKKRINDFKSVILIGLLCINILYGFTFISQEIMRNYSSAKQTAEFINDNLDANSIMIVSDMPYCVSIVPYTNSAKFWNPQKEDYFTYVTWDKNNKMLSSDDFSEYEGKIKKSFQEEQKLYYVYVMNNKEKEQKYCEDLWINEQEKLGNFTRIYQSSDSIVDETYIIYAINE